MIPHIHRYRFECESKNGHKHIMTGYTERMIGFDSFHFHVYYGISSFLGHTHYYSGMTGLPVRTENGHIHKLAGKLEINETHEHAYKNVTYEDAAYTGKKLNGEAYA